jgi:hypothetical protein
MTCLNRNQGLMPPSFAAGRVGPDNAEIFSSDLRTSLNSAARLAEGEGFVPARNEPKVSCGVPEDGSFRPAWLMAKLAEGEGFGRSRSLNC